jgi:hypothetical protein
MKVRTLRPVSRSTAAMSWGPHCPLEGVTLEAHKLGVTGGDQVSLGARRAVL